MAKIPPDDCTDLRGLEPPEPLMRIIDTIGSGERGPFTFLLAREPYPLYAILARDGYRYTVRKEERGVVLTVSRPGGAG